MSICSQKPSVGRLPHVARRSQRPLRRPFETNPRIASPHAGLTGSADRRGAPNPEERSLYFRSERQFNRAGRSTSVKSKHMHASRARPIGPARTATAIRGENATRRPSSRGCILRTAKCHERRRQPHQHTGMPHAFPFPNSFRCSINADVGAARQCIDRRADGLGRPGPASIDGRWRR